jgi:hypothetical protein
MRNNEIDLDLDEREIKTKGQVYSEFIHLNEKGLRLVYERCQNFIRFQRKTYIGNNNGCKLSTSRPNEQNNIVGGPEIREELLDESYYNNPISNQIGTALPEFEIMEAQQ